MQTDDTMHADIITVHEAAEYARVSERTILIALQRGDIRGVNLKGRAGWRTTRAWVGAWFDSLSDGG